MKRTFLALVALVLIVPVAALAGDYHTGVTLNCSECHTMHASQSHGYNANGGGIYTTIGGAAPYEFLLRNTINELCLTCHDNQTFAPDVLEANGGTVPTNGRLAGALNMNNTAPYYDQTGHTLGSTDVAPGGTWNNANGLECTDCHTPHGGAYYRNFRFSGQATADRPTYAVGTNDLTKDVFERASSGADHYDLENVDYNEPTSTVSKMAGTCKGCHTNFHGTSADANMNVAGNWLRHPAAEVDINATRFGARLYRPKVMSPTGDWGTQGVAWATAPADLTPSCFSCHASHGNTNGFALKYNNGSSYIGENGNGGTFRETCRACHGQGS